MASDNELFKIFKKLNIKVPDDIFKIALTHSSVTFENEEEQNYERLEFLGDSVLKLVMSEVLYNSYPEYNEGHMTKIRSFLVSDLRLAELGKKINLMDLIILGKNEKKDHGEEKDSVIACVMEAIIGAIYLSNGIDKASDYIKYLFNGIIEEVDKNLDKYNAKAVLQEYTQGLNKNLPEYILIKEEGKAHNKTFFYEIKYNNEILSQGNGKTKREAQQDAAKNACLKLKIFKGEPNE